MEEKGELEKVSTKFFDKDQKKYLPVKSPDLSMLTGRELQHIDRVLERLSDKTATELSELSHKDIPWIGTKMREVIDYEAVFYRTADTSVHPDVKQSQTSRASPLLRSISKATRKTKTEPASKRILTRMSDR